MNNGNVRNGICHLSQTKFVTTRSIVTYHCNWAVVWSGTWPGDTRYHPAEWTWSIRDTLDLEHEGEERQRREGKKAAEGRGQRLGLKIGMTWSTVKDPSDPVHRDHSLGLVLVQTRAHYNSHNRPDITSAVTRSPARRSSPKPHPSLSRAIFGASDTPFSLPFVSSSDNFTPIRNLPRSRWCPRAIIDCGTRLPGQPPRQHASKQTPPVPPANHRRAPTPSAKLSRLRDLTSLSCGARPQTRLEVAD